MDDKEQPGNKICADGVHLTETSDLVIPIKKVHFLEGKYFIVIDETIREKLKFSDNENKELYFQEEVIDDGCIILRPFKMGE